MHLTDVFRDAILLADGRQCLIVLIRQYRWRRIWIPDYYCYEVIETIKKQTGIAVLFYADNPLKEGKVEELPLKEGDVLLRINFFGMRNYRSNKKIPIPVIEDHSHDIFEHWALYSDADWCISSIRKSLPLPEGGMIWSPKQFRVESSEYRVHEENEKMAAIRWEAMEMKASYLAEDDVCKEEFRYKFTETEKWFDSAEPALIDKRSREFVAKLFDFKLWFETKRNNWLLLNELLNKDFCHVVKPEQESCTMFSLVLLMENKEKRDCIKKRLIEKSVYPAILWYLPKTASKDSRDFSERMLSVHYDGRYSEDDVRQLAYILNNTLRG